jgi:hypothetical protein
MICGLSRVGGGLQRRDIVHRKKGIVVLVKADLVPLQFLFHEGVPVEIVRGVEREERCYPDDDGAEDFVAQVKIVMGETARLMRQNAMVRILGGILRHSDPECAALLHAFEDEVDPVSVLLRHAAQRGQHVILFANAFPRPLHGYSVVAGEGFHPVLVIVGALAENFLAHHRNAKDLANEMNYLLGPGKAVQVAVDDDAVETVIYKNEKRPEKPVECVHGNISH